MNLNEEMVGASLQVDNLVGDFIDATKQTISQTSSLAVDVLQVREVSDSPNSMGTKCLDITGILGFSGGRKGSIIMTFSEELAMKIVGGMLGVEFREFEADVRDGIAELVNIVAGVAKTRLQTKGVNFELSVPNTIFGDGHRITAPALTNKTRIEFEASNREFFIEVCLKDE